MPSRSSTSRSSMAPPLRSKTPRLHARAPGTSRSPLSASAFSRESVRAGHSRSFAAMPRSRPRAGPVNRDRRAARITLTTSDRVGRRFRRSHRAGLAPGRCRATLELRWRKRIRRIVPRPRPRRRSCANAGATGAEAKARLDARRRPTVSSRTWSIIRPIFAGPSQQMRRQLRTLYFSAFQSHL